MAIIMPAIQVFNSQGLSNNDDKFVLFKSVFKFNFDMELVIKIGIEGIVNIIE